MKFSLLYDLRVPADLSDEPISDVYNQFLDQTPELEALGFDCIWMTEHHYSPEDQWISAALPMCAAIAARTERIEIGTGIIALPLHDPVRVAESVAVIDQISRGRTRLGVAIGYRREEFLTDRMPRKERIPRLVEGVELIRKAWAQDSVTFHGEYYQVDDLRLSPKPYRAEPPIYIAAQAEVSVRRAAQLGCHAFPNASRGLITAYNDELRSQNLDPAEFEIAVLPDHLFVTDDPERDWERYGKCFMYRWHYYDKAYSEGTPVDVLTIEDREKRIRGSVVTPDGAIEQVQKMIERAPCTEVALFAGFPGMRLEESHRSLELFSREVMPAFKDA